MVLADAFADGLRRPLAGTVKDKAATAQQQLADSDLPAPLRQPLPLGAIVVAAAAVIVTVVVLVRRRRS